VGARVEEYYGEIVAQRASQRHPFALPHVSQQLAISSE
jgi:hypothetical protein